MSILEEAKPEFDKAIDHLKRGLATVRTGHATPALVEDLDVQVYGAHQPLKQLASISCPDPKTVQIEPWDASVVKSIESAIMNSDLGMNPNVDGKIIRLNMPMMTEENRLRMVKVVKERVEESRIAVRQVREDVKKKIEKQESVGEDDIRGDLEEMDRYVKEMNTTIEDMGKKKEVEVTTI
jgi:ribosome recycling factor